MRTMSPRPPEGLAPGAEHVRLQKVLASAGLGSRRTCETLIEAGRVRVNGTTAVLGARVDPTRDTVEVDGARIPTAPDLAYLALNKPPGVVTAMTGDGTRPTVGDLIAERMPEPVAGLHHVGRLDADSEGLLLLTNDGTLSHLLTHPSHGVPKRYLVEVDGVVPRSVGRMLRAGIELEDGPARVDDYVLVDSTPGRSLVEVVV